MLFLAVCSALYLLTQGFFTFTISVPRSGGEYSEGLVGSPKFINPILSQANSVDGDLSRLIFSSLLAYDKEHNLSPDLAEKYEVSDDQLVYTFYLRKDVKWHDGESFKADDVIFTFSSIQDPNYKSPLGRKFRNITAEKIDDYTVKFILKEQFAPFITMMTFGILPEHLWYNIPPENADLNELNKKPIGTGQWKFEGFKKDKAGAIKSYSLVPNKEYHGRKPYLSRLIFKFYGDNLSVIDDLKNQSLDGIGFLPQENRDDLKKHKNVNLHQLDQPQYAAIFLNQKKNTLLQADYIRQALVMSIDRQKIVSSIFGGSAQQIDAPILSDLSGGSEVVKYPYDPEGAASLLAKNGWVLVATSTGDNMMEQVMMKKGWALEINLTVADQPQYLEVAKAIKEAWNKIGVKVNLEIIDKTKIIQENVNNRKYEALLFSENLSSDPDPFAFWHSSQIDYPGSNLALYSNKKVDDLLESARKINGIEERQQKYWEFQKIVSQDLPAIFLYSANYIYPQNRIVKGFNVDKLSQYSDRFANIGEWYIKTKRQFK